MKKIKQYHLCWNDYISKISDDVNTYIKNGFQPYGEPFISKDNSGNIRYCQAMVKYEE